MSLVPETGSIITGANTYATVTELRAFADLQGVELPCADDDAEKLLSKAMAFLESSAQINRYQGSRVSSSQALAWPRHGVSFDGLAVSSTEIPSPLKNAQMQLAIEANTVDLMPNRELNAPGPISSEGVGPLKVSYDNSQPKGYMPAFSKADAHLSLLFKRAGLYGVR